MNKQLLDNFVYFVNERELIHVHKDIEHLPPHRWTTDPILQTYRFCNVRREDDRVTRWIAKNWRVPADGHKSLPAAMLLARIINLPATLQAIGYPWFWDKDKFIDCVSHLMTTGNKVWTSAYMVTGTESKGMTKAEYTALLMDRASVYLPHLPTDSLKEASECLQHIKGISTFLAGQVIADLKYTSVWKDAEDWWTFAVPGPGSIRGLHRLHLRNYNKVMGEQQFAQELAELNECVAGMIPNLHFQDLQNCLCEWDKYQRALNEQGTPKQFYLPSAEEY